MADRYWNPSANGNWGSSSSWAATDGGATGASIPTSEDNVYFTSTNNFNCSINVNTACASLTCTGYTGTITGNRGLSMYGNLTLDSDVNWDFSNYLYIYDECLLTSAGNSFPGIIHIKDSGELTLADDLISSRFNNQNPSFRMDSGGTFNHNSKKVTASSGKWMIEGAWVFNDLYLESCSEFYVNSDIEIEGLLHLRHNTVARALIDGSGGDGIVLTCADLDLTGTDFWGITGAGAADWDLSNIPDGSGDCGSNSNITFTPAMTLYWVHGASAVGFIGNTDYWKTESGGDVFARIPLPQDTLIFDENSFDREGLSVGHGWTYRLGHVHWSEDVLYNPTWNFNGNVDYFGDIVLCNNIQVGADDTQHIKLCGSGNRYIDFKNFPLSNRMTVYSLGSYETRSNIQVKYLHIRKGIFDGNDYSFVTETIDPTGGTWNMRSGTWEITRGDARDIFIAWPSITINPGTSTLKFSGAMTNSIGCYVFLNDATFYNIENATSGPNNLVIRTGGIVHNFIINPGRTQEIYRGQTVTITGDLIAEGTYDQRIAITSDTTDVHYWVKTSGSIDRVRYCDISYSNAGGGAVWNAGVYSEDLGNNTGWIWPVQETIKVRVGGTWVEKPIYIKKPYGFVPLYALQIGDW